ncbi:MAG: DUF3784 domain-containing protein [Flavobacterium sp.]|nr:MAG: DUF3784 domain-containing protein [Flavobacterium sp.]
MMVVPLTFVLIGIFIKYGKMYFLIAGYNTLPAKEKAKVNIERIATLFRNVMFTMAAMITLGCALTYWTGNPDFENFMFYLAVLPGALYLVIRSNSGVYNRK